MEKKETGEGSGCRHYDVAGSGLGCSGTVSADAEEKGIAARSTKPKPRKGLCPKGLIGL